MSDTDFGFNPMPKRLNQIFKQQIDRNYFFKIPVFQREFSWGKNEITKLLDQISTSGPNGHFIGTIFTSNNNESSSDIYDVIDGQQRLTCLTLTILALWAYANKVKANIHNKQLQDIVENQLVNYLIMKGDRDSMSTSDYTTSDGKVVRLKLTPGTQNKNRVDYVALLNHIIGLQARLNPDELQQANYFKNRKMYKSYIVISDWVTKNLTHEHAIDQFIKQFLRTRFVLLHARTANDAADLFDGLNSTGLHLAVSDIVKNKVLGSYHANPDRALSMELSEANALWEQFTENIEFRNQTQYLKHLYYTLHVIISAEIDSNNDVFPARPVAEKELPDLYDVMIKRARTSDTVIRTIKEQSDTYKTLLNPEPKWADVDDKLSRSLIELNLISAQPAFSLLLFLVKHNYPQNELIKLIQDLSKLFARQHIIGLPKISFLDLLMVKTIDVLRQRDITYISAEDIIDIIVNYKSYWETEATTSAVLPLNELYQTLKGSLYDTNREITRYLLIKLANQLNTASYAQDQFHAFRTYEVFKGQGNKRSKIYTIEHIMPQTENLSDEWIKSILTGDDVPNKDYKAIHGQYLHMLGNLTLTADNSNLGSRSFSAKQKLTTKPIDGHDYNIGYKNGDILNSFEFNNDHESLANISTWNAEKISQRTEVMANELLHILTITIHGKKY